MHEGRYEVSDYERRACLGMSKAEASRDMGVSASVVWHVAEKHGIKFRDGRGSANESRYLSLHAAGLSNKEIAEACGASQTRVSVFLSTRGIARNKKKPVSKYEPDLRSMKDAGATTGDVAKALGLSHQQVSQLCSTLGISLRDGRRRK